MTNHSSDFPTEPGTGSLPDAGRAESQHEGHEKSAGANSGAASRREIPQRAFRNPHDAALVPSRLPRWVQQLGIAGFGLLMVVTVFFFATDHWRRGAVLVGAAMLWLALLRLLCDSQVMGVLAVRSRRFDFLFCTALGASILYLALSVDPLSN